MISRHWRGVARPEEAGNYINHLRRDTFPLLERLAGFCGATILKRETTNGIEFLIVTTWESEDAIKQFAGDSPHVAVVPPVVQSMMIDYDKEVVHYEVILSSGDLSR